MPDDPAHPVSVVFARVRTNATSTGRLWPAGRHVVDGNLARLFGALLGDHLRPHRAAAGSSLPPAIRGRVLRERVDRLLSGGGTRTSVLPHEVAAAYGALAAPASCRHRAESTSEPPAGATTFETGAHARAAARTLRPEVRDAGDRLRPSSSRFEKRKARSRRDGRTANDVHVAAWRP